MVRYAGPGRLEGEGGVSLVNLFSPRGPAEPQLTATLLALLEHTDRAVLSGLLEQAGMGGADVDGAEFLFPAPDGPRGVGEIRMAHRRVWMAAVAPGEEPPVLEGERVEPLLISATAPSEQTAPEAHWLSWERLDRWLEQLADQYDGESRTGFLLRQFRAYLPEAGIAYFAGFAEDLLAAVPRAHRDLTRFYQDCEELFDQLGAGAAAAYTLLRQSRPQDLLAGYCFRDYAVPGLGSEDFLRVALHLESAELQIACWLGPGGRAHGRLRAELQGGVALLDELKALTPQPVLWLWTEQEEQRIPISEVEPGLADDLAWDAYTVAVQVGHPFAALAGEGLLDRIAAWAQGLLRALAPLLSEVVH